MRSRSRNKPNAIWQCAAAIGGLGIAILMFVAFIAMRGNDACDYILNPRSFDTMVRLQRLEFYSHHVGHEYSAVCRSPELLRYFERLLFCSERKRVTLAGDGTRFAGHWLIVTFEDGASSQRLGASFDLSNDQLRVEMPYGSFLSKTFSFETDLSEPRPEEFDLLIGFLGDDNKRKESVEF